MYKARWEKKGRNAALLVLRHSNQAALSDMDNEIRMFGTLGKHKHLAQLLATCTQTHSEDKCMAMEFAPLGSLDHVSSKADEDGVDISNLVKIIVCMQVADAMTHLHLHNVLHCDLAIRNTLAFPFDPQNWKLVLVKVTDYGLSLLVHKGFTGQAPLTMQHFVLLIAKPRYYRDISTLYFVNHQHPLTTHYFLLLIAKPRYLL